ncbi:hypothetical protein O3Q51_13525 [Cryomorphaceae bacterium 1068]|nr:hypothetical protein [Cryomorphaceae bacterium 1068]
METRDNTSNELSGKENSFILVENQSTTHANLMEGNSNPFVGLRAFDPNESQLFFGREEHVSDVRAKLESNHFVAVVGTSGTGKSSLIRAGVLPSIASENENDESPNWHIVSMKPGNDPLGNLSKSVSGKFQSLDEDKTLTLIKRSSLGLVQAMRGIMESNERLLILVDQFEEVFRFTTDASEDAMQVYNHFVQTLVDTMRQRDIPIYLILTLRSDFLGDCVRFAGLPEAINDGHYLVPRMREEQIKRVITGPIALAEGRISPRVVQKVVQEMGNDSDRLPILQHALMRTYDVWQSAGVTGEPIDVKHLDQTGGINQALSTHADEAFNELSQDQQKLAAKIFKALTVKAEGSRGVRRPMSLSQLIEVTEASSDHILSALNPFRKSGRSFVSPGETAEVNDSTIFDISHESLMRGWKRLKNWTEEEMDSAALYVRISEAAALHKEGAAALWRDPELQLAEDWKARQKPNDAWGSLYHSGYSDAMSFLEKSHDRQAAEVAAKKRRSLLVRAAVLVFVVVVTSLSAWALYQSNIATEKSLEAQAKSEEALNEKARAETEKERAVEASQLAEEAQLTAEEEAARAERQAKIAAEQESLASEERNKAELAAALAMTEREKALQQKELADLKTVEALTEKQKADSARDEAYRLRMIALSENVAYQSAQITADPELAALLAIESFKLARENGGDPNNPSLYASAQRALENIDRSYSPIKKQLNTSVVAMSVAGSKAAVIDKEGSFTTFNVNNDYTTIVSETKLKAGEELNSAVFLSANLSYAIGLQNLNIKTSEGTVLSGHEGFLRGAAKTADGAQLITGGRDGLIKVWDGNSEVYSNDLGSRVRDLTRLGNKDEFLIALESGKTLKFKLNDKRKMDFSSRSGVRAETLSSSTSGNRIAIGYSDGIVELLSKSGGQIAQIPHVGSIKFLELIEGDDLLIVGTSAKAVFIYQLSNPTALPIEVRDNRPIEAVAFCPVKKAIIIATSDRKLKEYPVRNQDWINQLESLVSRQLTAAERETFIEKE